MLAALVVLSAALLAYQVALVHLLSITHWTHFAALVISLALLGFGASGSVLALLRARLAGRERSVFAAATALTALSFDPCYRLSTAVPFDAFELLAVPRQFAYLALDSLILSVPFFLGASAIALAFLIEPGRVGRVYAANLTGSGLGAVLGLALLALVAAERLATAVGLFAGLAVLPLALAGRDRASDAVAPGRRPARRRALAAVPPALLIAAVALPAPRIPVSMYKEESVALALPRARVLAERDGALGRLRLVQAPTLRYLPGASLALSAPVPPRPVLYLNGQPLGARALPPDTALAALTTTSAAFALPAGSADAAAARVLIVGLGGGGEVLHARARGAGAITVLDPDTRIDELLAPATLGPGVRREARAARGFLRDPGGRFERILVTEIGSLSGVSAGMASAGEAYLFTTEGVRDLWRALAPDGALAITRWVLEPPRDVLRLLATLRDVLDAEGLRAADHVALVRGWGTATLLASRRPLSRPAVDALRAWAEERWFDLSWAPGVSAEEANRFNLVEPDFFRIGAEALLGPDPAAFLRAYPFHVAPVTDDAPFFFHFLPLHELSRVWRAEGRLALPYFEWGLIAQVLALAQAIPLAAVLILLPLAALPRARAAPRVSPSTRAHAVASPDVSRPAELDLRLEARGSPAPLFGYFALLGLAFMLLEVSFIQRLILFLAQPIYATAAVLAAFLLFAGVGSAVAHRLTGRAGRWMPFAGIAVLAPAAYGLQGWLLDHAAAAELPVRLALAVVLLAPLAVCMGMPFPLGLQRVADRHAWWLPWCWAVNGTLSVIGAAAAPLIAVGLGFRGVLALAILLYLIARAALDRL